MNPTKQQAEADLLFSHFSIERAPDAILWVDAEARCRYVNPAACRLLGYSPEELRALSIHDFCPDHPVENWTEHWNQLKEQKARTFETRFRRKNGQFVPVEISSNYFEYDGKGYTCAFARDITARQQADEAIARLRRHTDLILNAAGEGIFGLDLKGIHTFVNPAAARMLGYTVDELLGRNSHATWHHTKPDGSPYPKEDCPIYGAYSDGQVHHGDGELFWRRDGTSFPAEYTSTPLRGDAGTVVGAVVTFRDISERRRSEEQIARLRGRSDLILNAAGEGIFGLDREGRHTFVNPAAARLLGYAPEELLGQHSHSLWHHTKADGSSYPSGECPIYGAYKDGLVHHGDDEVFWRKDGTSFLAEYTSTPIRDGAGKLAGAVVTFQDITERRRLAARLQEEEKVAEVTRVLGDIGHDIKNMLMPVLSGAQLLQEELNEHFAKAQAPDGNPPAASQKMADEIIDMITSNAKRIQDRVREIADAVKGVTSPPKFAPCEVTAVAASVVATLGLYAKEKKVDLRVDGLEKLPIIQADERRLFSALYNLVNNAIPEVPRGGSVTITGSPDVSGQSVVLSVVDTGKGMPPEIRESLFTSKAISSKAGGTGLGTKIVKDVVDAHAGMISVESEQGVGTTFRMKLPITQRSRSS